MANTAAAAASCCNGLQAHGALHCHAGSLLGAGVSGGWPLKYAAATCSPLGNASAAEVSFTDGMCITRSDVLLAGILHPLTFMHMHTQCTVCRLNHLLMALQGWQQQSNLQQYFVHHLSATEAAVVPDPPSSCTLDIRKKVRWGTATAAYQVRRCINEHLMSARSACDICPLGTPEVVFAWQPQADSCQRHTPCVHVFRLP